MSNTAYNYLEAMASDIVDYIRDNGIDIAGDIDDTADRLGELLWVEDGVTGNASGSYTFSRWQARQYVLDNVDLLLEVCGEFGIDAAEIGQRFLDEDWEWMDVSIRCCLLSCAIYEALHTLLNNE